MKKLVSFLIIAMLAMSTLASCSFLSGLIGGKDPIEYDLEGAKEYLAGYFEDESTTTPSDYEVPAQIPVGDYNYQITWTVDRQDITITVVNGMAKIDLNEKTPEEITYTLTATIADGNGETTTYTRTCTIPAYNVISFEDYMAAEKGATVTVEGIVVAMNGKSVGNSRNHLFLADASGKGGYYCYQLDDDPVAAGVEIGMTVTVTATVEPYSGMQETKGGTFAIVSTEKQTVAVKDITDTFKNGGDLKNLVGLAVTIKGVEVKEQDLSKDTSQYLYFELNGERGYVRTYITDFPHDMSHEVENNPDKIAIDTAHAEKFGWSANVTGILILYNGAPYLIPMSTDCFEYLALIVKTPAEKIEDVIEADISIPEKILEDTVITLPLAGKNYTDVTIAWAIDNNAYTIGADGKLSIALADEAVTLTLTATVSCDTATPVVKTYTISVKAASKGVYIGEHVDAPEAGVAYKFYLTAKDGKSYYFNGAISGNFLQTTTVVADAVDVFLEKVMDGETVKGYRFYFMDGETKTYIDINASGKAALVTADPAAVYNYVAETNCWAATIGADAYYLGTYSNYNTIGSSKTSYITADNTGKSQFPANFATPVAATYVPENQKAPEAGAAYKFYLTAKDGKNYYFIGEISGNFLQTSVNAADAVDVYLEKVMDGETVKGYRFYFMDGETKTYIDINASGKAALVTADPAAVYNYVAETNCWAATIGADAYYLGTYSNYNTIGSSKTSYITADNTGKSQFPANFATIVIIEKDEHVCEFADATCTAPKTCECGKTEGEALGHNIENKVCTGCGAKVVTVTEAAALEDGTLVFVEGTVFKITYAWSDSAKNMSVDITDGTTTLNAYKLATKVGAGDVIVIYGKVSSFNNNKQIAQGGTAEIKTAHTCTTYTEGKCPVCGANEPVANQTTATKTIAELITANNWDGTTTGQSFNLDDKVSVKVDGGSNSGKAYSGNHIRIYATDSPAGTLTITVAAGYELVSIKVSTQTGTYAFLCVDGSTTDISNVSTDVSGTSVVLNSVKNGTDGKQVRVTAIEVVYKVAE